MCFEQKQMFLRIGSPQLNSIWLAGVLEMKLHIKIIDEGIGRPKIRAEKHINFNVRFLVVNEVAHKCFYLGSP
jgi:hypothetical protein